MRRNANLSAAFLIAFIVILVSVPVAWTQGNYQTLYRFKGGRDGSAPIGGLIFDQAGNLYGTTAEGGAGSGTVFKLTLTGAEVVIHSFNGRDGSFPDATLIFDRAGNLYGTTGNGGSDGDYGTVFRLTPKGDGTWKETVLHSFNADGKDGASPHAAVIFDSAGNLYGTTMGGGSNGYGTVFRLTPKGDGTWKEAVLHSFNFDGNDGIYPYASLTFDSSGNLYGTTLNGGSSGDHGTVFKLVPDSDGTWTESVIHSFSYYGDGAGPVVGLVVDSAGILYGTTASGCGLDGCDNPSGTVFKLVPNSDGSWTENVIHSFRGTDGALPCSSVTFDTTGNMYGTTEFGGAYNDGTVYKLELRTNGNWRETVLHSFRNHPGDSPFAGVILDEQGSSYGTTQGDAMSTHGSVFKIP